VFLTLTIVGTISLPYLNFAQALPYFGASPPQVPLIGVFGKLIFGDKLSGLKRVSVANFISTGGQSFRLQDDKVTLRDIKAWTDEHPTESIYVEGFRLRDGAGRFWITFAETREGRTLIDREERQIRLDKRREWLGPALWWTYACVVAPLWLLSFNNIRKIRKTLGA